MHARRACSQCIHRLPRAWSIARSRYGRGQKAREPLARPIRRTFRKIIDLGVAQSGARQFREAIATFTRGLDFEPTNALLLRWRGHRYLSVREFDRAFADLTRGGAIDSTIYGILYHLGVVQYPARRLCRGVRIVRQSAADRPGCRRAGGFHGLVVDVAQSSRARRRSEGDARSPAARLEASDQCLHAAPAAVSRRDWSLRPCRLPRPTQTKSRSRRSPTDLATGTLYEATRCRPGGGSRGRSSRAVGPGSD